MELPDSRPVVVLTRLRSPITNKQTVREESLRHEGVTKSIKQEPGFQQLWNFHKCKWCPFSTKSIHCLQRHLKRHKVTRNSKLFNCMHNTVESYRCYNCGYKSSFLVTYMKHIRERHCPPAVDCKSKNDQIIDQALLKIHWKDLIKSYNCEKCSFKTNSQLLYVMHYRKCPVGHFVHNQADQLQKYSKGLPEGPDSGEDNEPDIQPLPPPPIPRVQASREAAKKNLQNNFFEDSETDKSIVSDRQFPPSPKPQTEPALQHVSAEDSNTARSKKKRQQYTKRETHPLYNKQNYYECEKCTTYSSKLLRGYLSHMYYTHKDATGWYRCEICGYRSMYTDNLRKHKLAQHSPIKCSLCSFSAIEKSVLKEHVQKEHFCTSDKKQSCESTLTKFKCDLCSFQTGQDEDLKNHILEKHVSEEHVILYKCLVCTFKFVSKYELEEHVMEKHVDPQFDEWLPCEMCTCKFRGSADLKKHIFAKHIM